MDGLEPPLSAFAVRNRARSTSREAEAGTVGGRDPSMEDVTRLTRGVREARTAHAIWIDLKGPACQRTVRREGGG